MGGNTGNIRTSRLSATGSGRTYMTLIASTNSAMTTCGGNKRVYGYWRCFVNSNMNDFYANTYGLNYGDFASRANLVLGR